MKKLIIFLLLMATAGLFGAGVVHAFKIEPPIFDDTVTICHCQPRTGCFSLDLDLKGAFGHLKSHDLDYWGQCIVPTPTSTPTPTVTPTVTPTLPPDDQEATPTATPTPETPVRQNGGGSKPEGCTQGCEAPVCTAEIPPNPVNFHIFRFNGNALLKWWPTGGNVVNIYYRQSGNNEWQYSVIGVPNIGNYEIHELGTMDIDFAIEQINSCMPGQKVSFMSNIVIDGVTSKWVLFR